MRQVKTMFVAGALAVMTIGGGAFAQGSGEAVISDPNAAEWAFEGQVRVAPVDAPPVPGGQALRATVARKGANPWDIQARIPLTQGVEVGDRVTFGFYARTTRPDPGKETALVTVRVQRTAAPYDAAIEGPIEIGADWGFHCLTGPARIALSAAELQVSVQLAAERHVIDFGPFMATRIPAAAAARQSGLPCGQPVVAGG